MIEVGHNPVLRLPSESILINDVNKPQLISELTYQYHKHFIKNCLTYELTYKIIKQMANGVFNRGLISEIFLNLRNNQICLNLAKKYMEDVKEILGEDLEEDDCPDISEEEVLAESVIGLSARFLEVESNYQRSIRCLGDELSVCSEGHLFLNQSQYHFSSPLQSPKRALEIEHQIDISISPPPEMTLPVPTIIVPQDVKPSGESDISTYSGHSLSKSCMITSKNKQFLIKPIQIKKEKIDYKKEYDKKIQGALVKNAMSMYKTSKKK